MPAVIEEVAAAADDADAGGEPEKKADEVVATEEEDDKDKGGAATEARSLIRNKVRSALGPSKKTKCTSRCRYHFGFYK